jgi:inhibitor of cysteine peptidase
MLNAKAMETITIDVDAASPSFQVILFANPTTGYQWTLKDFDNNLFEMIESEYIADDSPLIGAGGKMVYTFKTHDGKPYPKTTDMFFKYARSWELEAGTYTRVTIKFKNSLEN